MKQREIANATKSFNKLDAINAYNGMALKDARGETIAVKALAAVRDVDTDTGEITPVGIIISKDGNAYTTISQMAIDVVNDCISLIDDEGMDISLEVNVRTSKGGREFIALTIHDNAV